MENKDFVKLIEATGFGSVARELGLVDADNLLPAAYVQPPPTPKAPKVKAPVPPPPPETPTAPKPPPVAIDPPARRPSSRGTRVSPRETRRSSRAEAPPSETKRRRTETPKVDADKRGLRHFSRRVCAKVEERGVTTYNEVADDLVQEFTSLRGNGASFDEKNIRRRVYDALNVLMAMGIISKEKKEIRWCGLPSKQESMREDARRRRDRAAVDVRRKRRHLQELLTQHASLQNLAKLNKRRGLEAKNSKDLMDEDGGDAEANATLALPFIVVATPASTTVRCEVTDDRREVFFDFSAPFEIRDDGDVLRGLGLHRGMPTIQKMPPKLPSLSEDDASEKPTPLKADAKVEEIRAAYRREQEEARRLAAAKAGAS
mmetsp:Transcript_16802/g.44076  ORF Transcript_16802/g.44076 Transcript_16802/m.44076 type:complete len:374 (+) Transcript_16802:189-1310(+)